jgi:excisionase family DNA binding protein
MPSTTSRRARGGNFGEPVHNPTSPYYGERLPPRDTKVLLSVEEAAERLDIGRSTFYALIRNRQIRTIHVGRLRKVPVESLREFVDRQRAQHPDLDDAG